MVKRIRAGILIGALVCGVSSVPATAKNKASRSDRKTTIAISYGVVQSVETVKIGSAAAGGATIGGIAGLAVASGDTKQKVETAAAGAALGALIAHVASKHTAQAYVVRRLDGSDIKVIIDHSDAIQGDCVAIEEGRHTNLRRVDPTSCTGGEHHDDEDVRASAEQEAAGCHEAKQQLLDAATGEEVDRAVNKVKILCH